MRVVRLITFLYGGGVELNRYNSYDRYNSYNKYRYKRYVSDNNTPGCYNCIEYPPVEVVEMI